MNNIAILGNIELHGSMTYGQDLTEFPANPRVGMWCLKDRQMYAYIDLGGLATWYPLNKRSRVALHAQALPATKWIVQHGLATSDVWFQAQDESGNIQYCNKVTIDENSFELNFATPIAGRVVTVAPDSVSAPAIETQLARIANGTVIIDEAGIRINGINVPNLTEVTALISAIEWANVVHTPDTLAGYGILDAYTKAQVDAKDDALNVQITSLQATTTLLEASKATKTELTAGLATKANTTVTDALQTTKADKSEVSTALALKADVTTVNALNTAKADKATTLSGYNIGDAYTKSQTDTAIDARIQAVVGSAPAALDTLGEIALSLAGKTDAVAALTDLISTKVSTTTFNSAIDNLTAVKADKTTTDLLASTKADKVEVAAQLATKADNTALDAVALVKADRTYVDQQDAALDVAKANKATTLAGYGIGDAYTKTEIDTSVDAKIATTRISLLDAIDVVDAAADANIAAARTAVEAELATTATTLQQGIDSKANQQHSHVNLSDIRAALAGLKWSDLARPIA